MSQPYPDKYDRQLIQAFASLESPSEIQNFLRDLLTTKELKEAANRFRIATLLWQGDKSYLEISQECHTSTTTVTRVNDWLRHHKHQGYATILKRLHPKT